MSSTNGTGTGAQRIERSKSEIEVAIEHGSGRLDRFVGLAEALAEVAKNSAERLSEMLTAMPNVAVLEMKPLRAGEFTSACGPAGLFPAIAGLNSGGQILMHVDTECVALLVDGSLGGRLPGNGTPSRKPSKIDTGIVRLAARRFAQALVEALFRLNAMGVNVKDVSEDLDPKAVGSERRPIVFARFGLNVDDKCGVVSIGIGHEFLEPLTNSTGAAQPPSDTGGDPVWSRHFERHAAESRAGLVAILEERLVPLSEIAAMCVGDVLELRSTTSSSVRVECAGIPVMLCRLGKAEQAFALRIEGFIDRQFDFLAISAEEM